MSNKEDEATTLLREKGVAQKGVNKSLKQKNGVGTPVRNRFRKEKEKCSCQKRYWEERRAGRDGGPYKKDQPHRRTARESGLAD